MTLNALRRLWPLLVPILTLTAVWLRPILAGRFWAGGDGLSELFPQRKIAAWALTHGEFPFWNPYIFGGQPLFANIQVGVLSPFNWPATVLGLTAGENATVAIAYALMASGLIAFTRALGLAPAAAAVAALAFPLGGFITTYVGIVAMWQAAGLSAWLLWAAERHACTQRRRYLAVVAACPALMLFVGHPQLAAYGLVLAGAYTLARGAGVADRLVAMALGVGMGAVQLLPALDVVHGSQRHFIDYAWLTMGSVSPQALPSLLFPSLFGNATPTALLPHPLWAADDWRPALEGYAGPVTWLLALTALGRWRHDRMVAFWAAIAAAGLVLSLGHYTPLYKLWALLPFLNQMPYASRHGFEATFALAILAAYGLSWLIEAPLAARTWLMRASGVLATAMAAVWLAVWAYGPSYAARTQPFIDSTPGGLRGFSLAAALSPWQAALWLPIGLLAAAWLLARFRPHWVPLVLALDLWAFHWTQGPFPQLPACPTDLVLKPTIDWSAGRSLAVSERRFPFVPGQDELALLRRFHYPDVTMLTGEPTVNGYEAFIPARYGALLGMDSFGHAGEHDDTVWDPPHHALDLLGLGILRLEPAIASQPAWQRRLASPRWQRMPDEAGLVVLRNATPLPHAWRVRRARVLAPEAVDAAVRGLAPFDPPTEALLEAPTAGTTFAPGLATAATQGLNRIVLDTHGAAAGLVVIGSGYSPGWRAWTADGRELPTFRADALLLAVEVPAGAQRIMLAYEPPRWRQGLAVSLGTLLVLAAWLGRRKGRRPGAA
ncbi:MAG: putative rane protein [Cyanobacteria bacterium RYN_339]|nr:putative rane protein [Cyanobacteria bacterium RYN_339]